MNGCKLLPTLMSLKPHVAAQNSEDLQMQWRWLHFSDTSSSCNMLYLQVAIVSAIGWKFKVCYFDFCYFKRGSSPSFRRKKQTNKNNKSCASISDSKCSCGEWSKAVNSGPDLQHRCHQKAEHCLSSSYSLQNIWLNWIQTGSIYGFGNPKSLEFHISSSCRRFKGGRIGEKGLFSKEGMTRSRLRKGMTNRRIYPFLAKCWFCCSCTTCTTPLVLLCPWQSRSWQCPEQPMVFPEPLLQEVELLWHVAADGALMLWLL